MNKLFLFLAASFLVASCSTQQGGSPQTNHGRREFEFLKYRDPATNEIPVGIRSRELDFAHRLPGSLARMRKGEDVQTFGQFSQVGPWNIGGRTRAFAMDITDENVLLAGGVSGGMWRSVDAGTSWTMTTAPDELHNVTCVAQDIRVGKEHVWYYGTGEVYGNSARLAGNGIWKSIDKGRTWNVLPSTVSNRTPATHAFAYTWRIALDPIANRDIIYAATSRSGIQRSVDGGLTWQTTLGSDSYFTDVAVTSTGYLYATLSSFTGYSGQSASRSGVYRSIDGLTWENISPPDMPRDMRRAVIGIVPGSDAVFVIAETPLNGTMGVFRLRSGDREEWHSLWKYQHGIGWENRSAGIPLFGGRNGDFFSQGGYDLVVAVSPHDTNLVVVGGTNLYLSQVAFRSNAESSWIGGYGLPDPIITYPMWPSHHPDQHGAFFHPTKRSVLFSANDGGVMRTDDVVRDTVQWTELNRGYYTTQFYAIDIKDTPGNDDVIGGMQDNGTWSTNTSSPTASWRNRNGGDGAYCYFTEDGKNLYVATQQGRTRRVVLDDQGNEVARTRIDPIGVEPNEYLFISPYVLDPNDERIMYFAGGSMLWRNSDLTQIPLGREDSTSVNWDSLSYSRQGGSFITSVAAARVPANRVYYGTSGGAMFRMDSANVGDPVPVDVSNGLSRGAILNSICIDRRNGDHVLACFSNYGVISLYASWNAGANWQPISGNLEENVNGTGSGPAISWAEIVPFDDTTDLYVVATSTGLYFTPQLNGMSTVWTQVGGEEIGNVQIDMIVARYADKRIAVGTHGRGVYFGSISSLPPKTTPPTLRLPRDLARGIHPDTVLAWDSVPGALSYAAEVSTSADFSANVKRIDGITTTSVSIRDLVQGPTTYFWRVYAFAGGGASQASASWSFTTAVRPPDAVSPANREENVPGLPVQLTWTRIPEALTYDIELSTNLAFNVITKRITGIADTSVAVQELAGGTRYFWHVRSADADTFGVWSQRSQFTTGVLTSVMDIDDPMFTVSPNPAVDHVTVTVAYSRGYIEVADADGRIGIHVKVHDRSMRVDLRELAAGSYVISYWDGSVLHSRRVVVN